MCLLLLNYSTLFDHSFVENVKPHVIVIINNLLVEYKKLPPCVNMFSLCYFTNIN